MRFRKGDRVSISGVVIEPGEHYSLVRWDDRLESDMANQDMTLVERAQATVTVPREALDGFLDYAAYDHTNTLLRNLAEAIIKSLRDQ